MNGHELISQLNKLTHEELNRIVFADGCDCVGEAVGIRLTECSAEAETYQVVDAILVSRT